MNGGSGFIKLSLACPPELKLKVQGYKKRWKN